MKLLKVATVLILFCVFGGLGIAAFVDDSENLYTALEKAFYLNAEDGVWIRPGLRLNILDISIPADRKPVVTFRISDDKDQGLDRGGILTPGTVSTSFVLAFIPRDGDQYVAYTTRTQTSPVTGARAVQASTDSGGRYASLGDGTYTYTFGTTLPASYDASVTHTLGIYSARDLREFGLSRYIANELKSFVPDGSELSVIRDVARTASCNQCHDPLEAHGGSRQKVELCVLCHTPQTIDPDTGNSVDMKVMVHKIHRGADLPSVRAGKPYQIIGFGQGVNDYSTVHFPQDIRNCTTCHRDSEQVNNWLLKPTRETCGSCHDDVTWESGENHAAGVETDDQECATCHWPEGEFEYDASIAGAHTVPYKSKQLKGVNFEIVDISNAKPGERPVVQFKVTDDSGQPIAPSAMTSLNLAIAGPTSDYRWILRESARQAGFVEGLATHTFTGTLPENATGTYSLEIEGYVNATLNPGTKKQLVYRDAGSNVVKHFAVTGNLTPRRAVVDLAKCNKCHEKLQLHGNNRNTTEACFVCHNPATTDASRRPAAAKPDESVDMKVMIHKIHTGEELNYDYTVYGFGGQPINFNEIRYPGDRRNCLACHTGTSYTVPLPSSVTPSTTPRNFWDPTRPTAAACLGCHDSIDAAAHAFVNTASFGESCAVCHKESAEVSVSRAHAR